VDVDLYERRFTDSFEAVNLAGLDYKDVSSAALEGLAVDRPDSLAFSDELNLVIWVSMRTGTRARLSM